MNPLAALGGIAVISGIAFVGGWRVASDHYEAQGVKTLVKTITVTKEIGGAAAQAAAQAQSVHDHIVYRTRDVIREIPLQLGGDADLRLPAGFVRVYNDSLGLSANAGPSGASGGEAGTIRADDAIGISAANNGTCSAAVAQLNQLIDFYGSVKLKVNGAPN